MILSDSNGECLQNIKIVSTVSADSTFSMSVIHAVTDNNSYYSNS